MHKEKRRREKHTPKELSAVALSHLDHAAEIACYYGFSPIKTPTIEKGDSTKARQIIESDAHNRNYALTDEKDFRIKAEEKIALLRICEEQKLLTGTQPAMLYYEGTPRRSDQKKSASGAYKRINLEIIGTSKSIAEAELIKVAFEILRESGFDDLYVDINSVGDKDSLAHFTREVHQFYRKQLSELPAHCRQEIKKDLFSAIECENKQCREATEHAPKSIASLTEPSRAHFKEVLEYLESMGIPYKIDNHVLGNRNVCCHTVFLIKTLHAGSEETPEETLGLGFRYSGLAKKLDLKRDVPAVGLSIIFKQGKTVHKKFHAPKKAHAYLIQFGFDAKRKSLEIIELLRRAKVSVQQSLTKDKLTSQIATAENLGIPFVLIMGQKEAMEGSAIVRNMSTRMQETVRIELLADYLKKISKR
ncbi:MAG: hypothetical protein A2664_04265 [Candidatus Taylorbacteria bacterium RIFCSPHIGHO2_01_FULL_46_22b]|uniref:histidine--tRNA ligase n=1 Tax=Candidatus Taylorbacteria bacterium RIFCSPHIGHO2_01_FULL_46_22b TaxID=1802301 RepID=A0A1G2M1M1_9BACT|nr:MAG: hypothetical protein A2664_04265 [Candidatus Taylorbacteria bacterium RIFCSPHIGHO2_01_FULL_46_22b]